ncbi:MAG: glycosyltransferase [Clostridia bacterium]|nr:glycosyltransferase [Clostridia bacterium]
MNILIISEFFTFGGLETQILGQARALREYNHKVFLVTSSVVNDEVADHFDDCLCGLQFNYSSSYKDIYYVLEKIITFSEKNKASVIHAHPFLSLPLAYFASSKLEIPLVITIHGITSLHLSYGPVYDRLLRAVLLPEADHIFCVSQETINMIQPYVRPGSCTILPNGVNTSIYQSVGMGNENRWALVGRIDSLIVMGFKDFILKAKEIGLNKVDIYGDGPARPELENFIKEHGLVNKISLKGYCGKLFQELREGYTGIAGMGRVVLEGCAMNLPVILIGLDGTKGLLDTEGLAKNRQWNYIGRLLPNISSKELYKQIYIDLNRETDKYRNRNWVLENANEDIIWKTYLDNIAKFKHNKTPLADKILNLFLTHFRYETPCMSDEGLLSDLDDLLEKECPERAGLGEGRIKQNRISKVLAETHKLTGLLEKFQEKYCEDFKKMNQIIMKKEIGEKLVNIDEWVPTQKKRERESIETNHLLDNLIIEKEESIKSLKERIGLLEHELIQKDQELQEIYFSKRYKIASKIAVILWYIKNPRFLTAKIKTKTFLYFRRVLPASTKQWIKKVILRREMPLWQAPEGLPFFTNVMGVEKVDLKLPTKYDIIVFSIIDWDFRFQRPQQIATILAKRGHRVFYLNTAFNAENLLAREIAENIIEVKLPRHAELNLYRDRLSGKVIDDLFNALVQLNEQYRIVDAVSIVQLPFWLPMVQRLRTELGWKIIYDCMDKHSGFSTNNNKMLSEEESLARNSDLVITTSRILYEEQSNYNKNCILVPNAVDFSHFNTFFGDAPEDLKGLTGPIIGYYGAISDWFDVDLVSYMSKKRKDWYFILVGSTFGAEVSALQHLPNVILTGEKSYKSLPGYLHSFDVCMIPFKINPLTESTNPVKFYEYLSAGKPVVSTPLPELFPYDSAGLVSIAETKVGFHNAVEKALENNPPEKIQERIAFARTNTWNERVDNIESAIPAIFEPASIIIVTYNNLHLTEQCVTSIYENTIYPNFELIIVDNASTDGTREFLLKLAEEKDNFKIILNDANMGFAVANNQGIKIAAGYYIVLLNNDTIVTTGWLGKLIRVLESADDVGMVGPATNSSGNESQIDVSYNTINEMEIFAYDYMARFKNMHFEVDMLAMFCVISKRSIIEKIGLLDEQFGIGMFEDDDYAMRLKEQGYRLLCAQGVFVHHFGKASFKRISEENYYKLFKGNRKKFEKKWGGNWEPPLLRNMMIPQEERDWVLKRELEWILQQNQDIKGIIIYPPTIDWGERLFQRPQQLALGFAKMGYLFFYCVVNPSVDKVNGFKRITKNLYLCFVPLKIFKTIKNPVVWVSRPDHLNELDNFIEAFLVYDYIDELEVFHTFEPEMLKKHQRLLEKADLCLATASKLLHEMNKKRPDAIFCPNAADYEYFARAQCRENKLLPEDMKQIVALGKPIIGYYGALAEWFDYDLMMYAARKRKDYTFVLIGPDYDQSLENGRINRFNNIYWLNSKQYHELAGYLAYFDVAVIPFKINKITLATNPIKMFEYMSAGKPVVTTAMPECTRYPEVIISNSPEEFVQNLDRALQLKEEQEYINKLIECGRSNSWDARVLQVSARLPERT